MESDWYGKTPIWDTPHMGYNPIIYTFITHMRVSVYGSKRDRYGDFPNEIFWISKLDQIEPQMRISYDPLLSLDFPNIVTDFLPYGDLRILI